MHWFHAYRIIMVIRLINTTENNNRNELNHNEN